MPHLLALICGILLVPSLSTLPPLPLWYFPLLLILLPFRPIRMLVCFALGGCWGIYAGHQLVNGQLLPILEGKEIVIRGDIVDLPQQREVGQRFLFKIDHGFSIGQDLGDSPATEQGDDAIPVPRFVLLTWYGQPTMAVGQRWQFVVKLKRPRALVNDGGFDYQRWLLSRKIGATGYVRQSKQNQQLIPQTSYPLQQFRAQIRDWIIANARESMRGPLLALAIGDNSSITQAQWGLFRATGTGHLMAISGLHIGLIAVFGFILGRILVTACALLDRQWFWLRVLPGLFSCAAATAYSALAGFDLPTQRALVMVLLLNLAALLNRGHQPLRALALAALVVLVIDPLAGLDLGFWLSFGAVAMLLGYFLWRHQGSGSRSPLATKMVTFVRAQGVVFIGLLIPLLVFNIPISVLAPLANLVVIPVVSLLVVIPLLAAVALHGFSPGLGAGLINLAGAMLELSFRWLELLQNQLNGYQWSPDGSIAHWSLLLVSVLGVAVLAQARGLPGRWLGLLLIAPALLPVESRLPPLTVTVLDVGQGLAVVAQTPDHTLLYDTGARFSERFNIGEAVVLSFLRHQGITKIDTLVVSHADNDHAGGAAVILDTVPVDEIFLGQALDQIDQRSSNSQVERCEHNRAWQWEGVAFQLIEPDTVVDIRDNNNLSCVLMITYQGQHVLLPGDIEARVERVLIGRQQLPSPVSVVIAPHHGSRTSSTRTWVDYLQPRQVIFSAAFGSRYGHPHPQVTRRYQQAGASLYNTADRGQIQLQWSNNGELEINTLRQRRRRYWY